VVLLVLLMVGLLCAAGAKMIFGFDDVLAPPSCPLLALGCLLKK